MVKEDNSFILTALLVLAIAFLFSTAGTTGFIAKKGSATLQGTACSAQDAKIAKRICMSQGSAVAECQFIGGQYLYAPVILREDVMKEHAGEYDIGDRLNCVQRGNDAWFEVNSIGTDTERLS